MTIKDIITLLPPERVDEIVAEAMSEAVAAEDWQGVISVCAYMVMIGAEPDFYVWEKFDPFERMAEAGAEPAPGEPKAPASAPAKPASRTRKRTAE